MNFLSTDTLLELVLGADGLLLAAVLTVLWKLFNTEKGQAIEATLETGADFVIDKVEQGAVFLDAANFLISEGKERVGDYKRAASDGISMAEAQAFAKDAQAIPSEIRQILKGKGGDAA